MMNVKSIPRTPLQVAKNAHTQSITCQMDIVKVTFLTFSHQLSNLFSPICIAFSYRYVTVYIKVPCSKGLIIE